VSIASCRVERRTSGIAGGFAPNHALNGTPEFAYGVTPWWELGWYIPFAVADNQFLSNGAKIRTLFGEADFVPAVRLARKLGEDFYIGAEYYANYGKISNFPPLQQQQQLLFAVTDFKAGVFDIDLGLGFGLTPGSDQLIGKIIIGYAFPAPGGDKGSDSGSRGGAMMPKSMTQARRAMALIPVSGMIQ
jgi:hypothetical protein